MSVAVPAVSPSPSASAARTGAPRWRAWRTGLGFTAIALGFAFYVTYRLWRDPYDRGVALNIGDHALFEWGLGYGAYAVTHGVDPFFTHLYNAPLGVNLAANTSFTFLAVLFSPLTLLAGPQLTFAVILTLNLAGSAVAWFLFLRRWLVRHPVAAGVGGLFLGFAPGMVSHANAHLNWSASWMAAIVVWRVLKLREPGRWLRNGLLLGLWVAAGFSVAAEGLFFIALACGVFLAVWALSRATWSEARAALPTVLAGLGVTATVAGALLAYPIYMFFAGPQTFSGVPFVQQRFVEDPAAYLSYAPRSLAGKAGFGADIAPNQTEENTFFGLPLTLLILVAIVVLWWRAEPGRRATIRALTATAVFFMVLSWGPLLEFNQKLIGTELPFEAVRHLPLFDSALPGRMALIVVVVFGILLALTAEAAVRASGPLRALTGTALAVALVPLIPLPLLVVARAPEPAFIADGTWQRYVPEGGTLSTVPIPHQANTDGQRWQAYTLARGGRQFRIPGGHFLGPGPQGRHAKGMLGAIRRPTDAVLLRAALTGTAHRFTPAERDQARADFGYWNVSVLVLPDELTGPTGMLNRRAVLETATDLLGPPERVDDVLLWRIRPGVDPVAP